MEATEAARSLVRNCELDSSISARAWPGRTPSHERTHRLNDDRIRRGADPQGQPAALAKPAPPGQDH